jgi:RNase adaptor protein for sRNA GlmZ degradation
MTLNPTPLSIEILSFSYKSALPPQLFSWDEGRHGGGFVFDCRCLPNPGRETAFKSRTGLDGDVSSYLEERLEVIEFSTHVFALIQQAVENYVARGFTSLSVGFGCTGGQHRSVFFAQSLANFLAAKFGDKIKCSVQHPSLQQKGLLP